MKFGFIAHPADEDQLHMLNIYEDLQDLNLGKIVDFFTEPSKNPENNLDFINLYNIRSKIGSTTSGKITYIHMLPEEIIKEQEKALRKIIAAAQELEGWGADIIGLGAYTAVIGGRGKMVQEALQNARVTTGNSYTAYTAVKMLNLVMDRLNRDLNRETIILIGFPGSIILAIAHIFASNVKKMVLVGRRTGKYFSKIRDEINALNPELTLICCNELEEALHMGKIIITATSMGSIINQKWLNPGSIVIDVAEPKDVIKTEQQRKDILIIDGGRFSLSEDVKVEGMIGRFMQTGLFGCVGETILLALEGRKESFSFGRRLPYDKVLEIGKIGYKHGFEVKDLTSWGQPVKESILIPFKNKIFKNSDNPLDHLCSVEEASSAGLDEMYKRHSLYINPVLSTLSKIGNYRKKFINASGVELLGADDEEKYFDFVGGYGSVNIGHNHSAILDVINKYFETSPPSFLQVVPGIYASALAENLAMISPGNLEMSFFCNSGTEAVEGALKLARIYTDRIVYVSAENSFHGKSYGSLSVTGREKYQKHFRPLLPECRRVDFGDLNSLETALSPGDVAAFIVEPIQGEGGVILPPEGYLKEAKKLCRKYGTLLIIDEIQTGFGRTGKMFACDHEGVVPDIMTLAKSLSGGLVPIGAYMTNREIWQSSYGTQDTYLLHTSTFGGNNFSCIIGMTAIEVILKENLINNAAVIGNYLKEGIEKIVQRYDFIKEVRGRGLMIGIEFERNIGNGLDALINTWMNSASIELTDYINSVLLGDMKASMNQVIEEFKENIERRLNDNFATKVASILVNDFNILTIVTLNNPRVMRIQPPLVITKEIADYFLNSFKQVCKQLER